MEIVAQIITGIVVGIVALGLLIFIFRIIFARIDTKVDDKVFQEYTLRIADNFETSKRRFDKLDNGQIVQTEAVNKLAVEMGKFSVGVQSLLEKLEKLEKPK